MAELEKLQKEATVRSRLIGGDPSGSLRGFRLEMEVSRHSGAFHDAHFLGGFSNVYRGVTNVVARLSWDNDEGERKEEEEEEEGASSLPSLGGRPRRGGSGQPAPSSPPGTRP